MVFLQVLAVLLCLAIVVLVLYGLKRFQKRKGHNAVGNEFLTVLSILPSLEISLEDSAYESWTLKERLTEDQDRLKKIGFEEKGYYVFSQDLTEIRVSLLQLKNSILVAITEAAPADMSESDSPYEVSYSAEAVALIDNNGSVCVTNSTYLELLPRPTEHPFLLLNTDNVVDLVKAVKTTVPKNRKVRPIKDAKQAFLRCYQEMAEWLWEEDQLRSEKMKETFLSLNLRPTEKLIEELVGYSRTRLSDVFSEKLIRAVSTNPKISPQQWERMQDKLVVVHEKMDVHSLCKGLYALVGDDSEEHVELIENLSLEGSTTDDPVQTFKKYFNLMSLEGSAKKIASINNPVVGEVYIPR